jgi:NADPH:quinone reductase-like Zn-dependent oxidoreductase
MRAYQLAKFGIEHLQQIELPKPTPAPGQLLLRMHAAALNYRDLLVIKGVYNPKMQLPRILCSDGAGEVVEIGDGVSGHKSGDRVCCLFFQQWLDGRLTAAKTKGSLGGDVDGTLTEFMAVDAASVIRFPDHLSYQEAATLPCAGLTAWHAIAEAAHTAQNDVVLIQGTGGVSIFALQFAKLFGARVLGTSSSDEKLARAKSLGLDAGLNYRATPDWSHWVREQTGNTGADLVVEVGGAGTLAQSMQSVRIDGMIALIGVLAGAAEQLAVTPILHRQINIRGIYVGSREMFARMNLAISQHKMRPVIDHVFRFDEFPQALDAMARGPFGKLVVQLT